MIPDTSRRFVKTAICTMGLFSESDLKQPELGEFIKRRRKELGLSEAELARSVGIKQPSLHKIEKGVTEHPRYLREIFKALNIEQRPDERTNVSTRDNNFRSIPKSNSAPWQDRNCPVYFMQPHDAKTSVTLPRDAKEFVALPALLATVKGAFGICICGDDNLPAYKPGDIVFVHPHHPPVLDTDVVLRPTNLKDMRVCIGELKAVTITEWHVLSYNQKDIAKFNKAEWDRIDRIVAKYNRR